MKCYPYIIIVLIFISIYSCDFRGYSTMGLEQAASFILGDSLKMIRWKLVQTYDPYQGGRITKQDSINPRILEIYNNGTFKVYESDLIGRGKWYIKSDKSAIAFIYAGESGEVKPSKNQAIEFTHQIRRLTRDTMILAWQGRHGFIEELYVSQRKSPKQILPVKKSITEMKVQQDSAR